ncbi:uncharacterized protein LOC118753966 [Rhagoletis pomonella]|uniref:uncharacterized protein LOC118753966 n=1 Tax=Rhagoletis pomonella TaxID=28610 RepID=UPI00177F000C|nr:uncharacterized protein LOC118753966 [Rhagoletis pomonella]
MMGTDDDSANRDQNNAAINTDVVNAGSHVEATFAIPKINPPSMADTHIESYFMSLEFWFAASGIIADSKKYNIVMAQVPPVKLSELQSIISELPTQNKYEYVKEKLIKHFAESQQRRLQKVISEMPLGDLKPSQLFSNMKRVAGQSLNENILIDLWTARLPAQARAAIIASEQKILRKVKIADDIVESLNLGDKFYPDSNVRALTSERNNSETVSALETLQKEIAQLSQRLNHYTADRESPRNRGRNRPRESVRSNMGGEMCWYHLTFGKDARSCRKPCCVAQAPNKQ